MLKAYLLKCAVVSIALTASLAANAASDVVFSCKVKGGKQIKITKVGVDYQYSFGLPNDPELIFRNTKKQVVKQSPVWNGQGSHIWTGMLMVNGKYNYHVIKSTDRRTEEHEASAEVVVSRGEKYLSSTLCIADVFVNWDEEFVW